MCYVVCSSDCFYLFFFFSSRRRHTRWPRDWSSDVCSSDLINRPFSIGGDQQANINEIQITVNASFQYATAEEPMWTKSFTGSATYNVLENPVDGELGAAEDALQQISTNMLNDAVRHAYRNRMVCRNGE